MIFDLSRLVHDLLDVARVPGSGRLRQAQEIGLTAITLATLADWLGDKSPAQERSKIVRRAPDAGRRSRPAHGGDGKPHPARSGRDGRRPGTDCLSRDHSGR